MQAKDAGARRRRAESIKLPLARRRQMPASQCCAAPARGKMLQAYHQTAMNRAAPIRFIRRLMLLPRFTERERDNAENP